jgi:hypothetical protein
VTLQRAKARCNVMPTKVGVHASLALPGTTSLVADTQGRKAWMPTFVGMTLKRRHDVEGRHDVGGPARRWRAGATLRAGMT